MQTRCSPSAQNGPDVFLPRLNSQTPANCGPLQVGVGTPSCQHRLQRASKFSQLFSCFAISEREQPRLRPPQPQQGLSRPTAAASNVAFLTYTSREFRWHLWWHFV